MTLRTARVRFQRVLESVVIVLLAALALLVIVGVAFRKAGAALAWYDEVASVLLAWVTYYGAGLAALTRSHIGFPKLVERATGRVRVALVVARETAVIGFFAVAAWAGWRVLTVLEGNYLVTVPIPTQLTQSVIPIGAVLFIVAELLSLTERNGGAAS